MIIGVSGPTAGYGGTLLTAKEGLQILSLVIGIAVGLASLISICFTIRRKWLQYKRESIIKIIATADSDDEETTTI